MEHVSDKDTGKHKCITAMMALVEFDRIIIAAFARVPYDTASSVIAQLERDGWIQKLGTSRAYDAETLMRLAPNMWRRRFHCYEKEGVKTYKSAVYEKRPNFARLVEPKPCAHCGWLFAEARP